MEKIDRKKYLSLFLRCLVAIILLQTLYFKFSGAEISISIFTKLGVEPWGRWITGVLELFSSILILIPKTVFLGAFLGGITMLGAVLSHILFLGITLSKIGLNDHGELFFLALIALSCCIITALLHKREFFLWKNN